jgi:hypothetical protein
MSRLCLALAAVALLAAAASGARSGADDDGPSRRRATATTPAAPDIDLWEIRDIFRYADRTPVESRPGSSAMQPPIPDPTEVSEEESRARLVGLMRKGGRPVAALVIDGEVVVLGEGESSGGFTVIAVDAEAVSLWDPEGEAETLLVP